MPTAAKTKANMPKYVKSKINCCMLSGYKRSCLVASFAYVIGFTFATVCSQSGIREVGNKLLLAKSSGRFNRFITAI